MRFLRDWFLKSSTWSNQPAKIQQREEEETPVECETRIESTPLFVFSIQRRRRRRKNKIERKRRDEGKRGVLRVGAVRACVSGSVFIYFVFGFLVTFECVFLFSPLFIALFDFSNFFLNLKQNELRDLKKKVIWVKHKKKSDHL